MQQAWEAHREFAVRRTGHQPSEVLPGLFLGGHPARYTLKGGKLPANPLQYLLETYDIQVVITCCAAKGHAMFISVAAATGDVTHLDDEAAFVALVRDHPKGTVLRLNLPLDDAPEFDISPYFGLVDRVVTAARGSDVAAVTDPELWLAKGGVLIHCQAGASRSATLLAGHLMRAYGISDSEALELMDLRRPNCVNPNPGFRAQLKVLGASLEGTSGTEAA
eukprot:Rhum_TRINITY_DN23109_c0_g1::Rhum_TRINITY_DN23109_c0_g1_i1::g.177148::m.177148